MFTAAVITCSDKGYRGQREDTSGPYIVSHLESIGFDVVDKIASKFGVKFHKPVFKSYYVAIVKYNGNKFILIKPNTLNTFLYSTSFSSLHWCFAIFS